MNLKVVTPEEVVFEGEVEGVYLETPEGEIGILPHHTNLMSKVIPGELRIKSKGKISRLATGEGLLQMVDNSLSILTDLALEESKIDEKNAEEARKRAQTALEQTLTAEEIALTEALLERSLAQLKVKRRFRG